MKFSGTMCLKIILKVTKNQGFTQSSEYTVFEKPQGFQLTPPSPPLPTGAPDLGLSLSCLKY